MYKFLGFHFRNFLFLFRWLSLIFRVKLFPESKVSHQNIQNATKGKSIIYVLPRMSIMDILAINKALRFLQLPPVYNEARPRRFLHSALLALKHRKIPFYLKKKDDFSNNFINLIIDDKRFSNDEFLFLPVQVFWSRSPEKDEKGFLLKSLFPDDGTGNGLQKLLMLLLHRGEVTVDIGTPISEPLTEELKNLFQKREIINNDSSQEALLDFCKKYRRFLNIEFAKQKARIFGPTLYDFERIAQWILSSDAAAQYVSHTNDPGKTQKHILRYIKEISSNFNYISIRAMETILDFVWNNVFEGVRVYHFEGIEQKIKDAPGVWTPSHRSHFDYLLISWVLFKRGLAMPHVAAGINLNFWPIGSLLRRGGAFFIRRSFAGNKNYAFAFSQYLNFLMLNSYPVEFFHEGGRSRIGKLLVPKIGMLSMCVQSIIQRKADQTFFFPIYLGYDKVMEDETYAKELRGAKKQKENVFQFLNGIRKIFANYGNVHVSYAEPLCVGQVWEEYRAHILKNHVAEEENEDIIPKKIYQVEQTDTQNLHITDFVKFLSKRINEKINSAAVASSTSLLCAVMLCRPKSKIPKNVLCSQLLLFHNVLNQLSQKVGWRAQTYKNSTETSQAIQSMFQNRQFDFQNAHVEDILKDYFHQGLKWKFIKEFKDQDASFVTIEDHKEFNLWWYRGTIFHLFIPFSVVARKALRSGTLNRSNLISLFKNVRTLWKEELFWDIFTTSEQFVDTVTETLVNLNILKQSDSGTWEAAGDDSKHYLEMLERVMLPEMDLYTLPMVSAQKLASTKNSFSRDELFQKTKEQHAHCYSQMKTNVPSVFTSIFFGKIFQTLLKNQYITHVDEGALTVNPEAYSQLMDFFDFKRLK